MKKTIALLTAAIMTVLSVTGCNGNNQGNSAAGTDPAAEAETAEILVES